MKPSLQQTTLVGAQRLVGAMIGAAAAVLLLIPASEHVLDVPQPANYGAEGDRVIWTLCGV
jgi:hypothetical protein